MNKVLLIMSLLCSITHTYSQHMVQGNVRSDDGSPVANVTVTLLQQDSLINWAITNDHGLFTFEHIASGTYQLALFFLGYKSINQKIELNANMMLPTFYLVEDVQMLSEISVTANRGDIIKSTANSTVFQLSDKALKNSSDAFEALRELPKLVVDASNKNIRLSDGSSPLILINGVNRPGYINSLNPADIESVELIENPSARYRGEQAVSSILNLKIKRRKQIYTNGNFSTKYNTGLQYGFSNGSFEFGNSKASLFLNAFHFYFDDEYNTESSMQNTNFLRNTTGISKNKTNMVHLTLGGDWVISEKDQMAFSIEYTTTPGYQTSTANGIIQEERVVSPLYTNTNIHNRYSNGLSILYYKHQFSQISALELTGRFGLGNSGSDGWREEVSDGAYKKGINMDNEKLFHTLETNYSFGIEDKTGFNAGNNVYHQQIGFDDKLDVYTNYTYKEWRDYLYVDATSQSDSPLSYAASLGLDIVFLNTEETKNSYYLFVPTLSLAYKFNSNNLLRLQANRNRLSPSAGELNPRNMSTDSLFVYAGNPYLRPGIDNHINLSYEWKHKGLYVSPFITYYYYTDMVESTGYTQGDVYYSSYANLGKLHALRTGISYRIRLGSWGNLNMNMFYRKSFYKDYPFSGDALGAQGNLFLSYKKLSLNMFANYIGTNYSKTDKSNYHTESETTLSWRCSKQFTVSAGLRYFMPGFKDYMWTKNGSFSSYNKYTVPHLMPMIGISLNFRSKANVGNRQKPQLYNTEEDMNIKVK